MLNPLQQRKQNGLTIYDPRGTIAGRQGQATQRPSMAPARQNVDEFDVLGRMAANVSAQQQVKEEEGGGNAFGRGLGFLINNPVTATALKPLQVLDYGRRAVTLGLEEFATGITGQELKAMEGDTRSNMDKLKDPAYGVGQLLGSTIGDMVPGTWNDGLLNNAAGFIGDVALDPVSYVGGMGFATKGAAAGGRMARVTGMSRVLNAARKAGKVDDAGRVTKEVASKLDDIGRRSYGAADAADKATMGVRGGIRMTTNPLSPYHGLQGTIPGTEKLTEGLSMARTKVGEVARRTNLGKRTLDWRTPGQGKLDDAYRRIFLGEGDLPIDEAIDFVVGFNRAAAHQGAVAAPLLSKYQKLIHATRNLDQPAKEGITDRLESTVNVLLDDIEKAVSSGTIPKLQPTGNAMVDEFRNAYFEAWWKVTRPKAEGGLGIELPLNYRQKFSSHITTHDYMQWKADRRNAGKIKAPDGFFTETMYEPSGVTMGRKFKIGDEFEVNGQKITIETGIVGEINKKFRDAGLPFDVFESDPGIILEKYINMLSDDAGAWMAARDLDAMSGGLSRINMGQYTADGRRVTEATPRTLTGGAKATEGDAAEMAARLGLEDGLAAPYKTVVEKDLTKTVNEPIRSAAAQKVAAERATLKARRTELGSQMSALSKGEAGWPGAPSLKDVLTEREATAAAFNKQLKDAHAGVKQATNNIDVLTDRYVYLDDAVKDIDAEIAQIEGILADTTNNAVPEMKASLYRERRVLNNQLVEARQTMKDARARIAGRAEDAQNFDAMIAQRRAALYGEVGLPEPQSGLLPGAATGPVDAPLATGTKLPGRDAAQLENRVANKIIEGKGYKTDLKKLSQMTGRSEDDILADLTRRGAAPRTPKAAPSPARQALPTHQVARKALADAREQVVAEARAFIERVGDRPPGMGKIPKTHGGEWDALKAYYQGLNSTAAGRKLYRQMGSADLINTHYTQALKVDDWGQSVAEALGRPELSMDDAVAAYFAEAERLVKANVKRGEPSQEVIERAAAQLGVDPKLITASANPAEFRAAVTAAEAEAIATTSKLVDDLANSVPPERIQGLIDDYNHLKSLPDSTEASRSEALWDELEQMAQESGMSPDGIGAMRAASADDVVRKLEGADITPKAAAVPAEPKPFVTNETARVPSSELADEYVKVQAIDAKIAELEAIDKQTIPNIERGVARGKTTLDDLKKRYPDIEGAGTAPEGQLIAPGRETRINAQLNRERQVIADAMQASTDPDRVRQLKAAHDAIPRDAKEVIDHYDSVKAAIARNEENLKTLKDQAPTRRKDLRTRRAERDKQTQFITDRLAPPDVRPGREAARTADRDLAARESRLNTIPDTTRNEGLITDMPGERPNLEAGASDKYFRATQPGASDVAKGKTQKLVPPGDIRDAIGRQLEIDTTSVRNWETQVERAKDAVLNDPKVARLRADRARAFNESGGVTKGKVDLPPRPGPEVTTKAVKGTGNVMASNKAARDFTADPEFLAWSKEVDDIMDGVPIRGSYPSSRMPQGQRLDAAYAAEVKRAAERHRLNWARQNYKDALERQAQVRTMYDKVVNVGDDPASISALSKELQATRVSSERDALTQLEAGLPATKRANAQLDKADEALAQRAAASTFPIAEDMRPIGEQLNEIATNPEARQAIEREATDAPWADNLRERQARLGRERDASNTKAVEALAQLPKEEEALFRFQYDIIDAAQGNMDAAQLVGRAKGELERIKKLSPKNKVPREKVEDTLTRILAEDPGLKNLDNQAVVYGIVQAEQTADLIKDSLVRVEQAGLEGKGEYLNRVVKVVLDEDNWQQWIPDIGGPYGPIASKEIIKMMQTTKRITSDSKFWRTVDTFTGLFKTYATLTPGFHTRNAMSGLFMNASDGVDSLTMYKGANTMRSFGRARKAGDLDAWYAKQAKTVLNEETGATMADAMDAVAATGIGGRYREHGIGDRSLARNRITERAYENFFTYNVGKRPGAFVESSLRLPMAMDTLAKGGDVQDAINRITRVHFDYSQVSTMDAKMRQLIPFWTFMSRNFPLQISQMYTNPRTYAKFNTFVRNFRGENEPGTPDYFGDVGAFRLGETKLAGLPLYLQPDLQHTRINEDVQKLQDLLEFRNPARAFTDFNPLFTAPYEYMAGRDMYTGREFTDTDVRKTGKLEAPIEAIARLLKLGETTPNGDFATDEKFINAFRSLIPVYDRSVRLAPGAVTGAADKDAENRQIESYLRFIGVPIRQLSPQQQAATVKGHYYEQMDQQRLQQALAKLDQAG